jgi:hypothetical protein
MATEVSYLLLVLDHRQTPEHDRWLMAVPVPILLLVPDHYPAPGHGRRQMKPRLLIWSPGPSASTLLLQSVPRRPCQAPGYDRWHTAPCLPLYLGRLHDTGRFMCAHTWRSCLLDLVNVTRSAEQDIVEPSKNGG